MATCNVRTLFGAAICLSAAYTFCATDGGNVEKVNDSEFAINVPFKEPSWVEAVEQEKKIALNEQVDELVVKGCIEATPEVYGQLYQEIKSIAEAAKIKMPRVVVIPRFSLFNLTEGGGVFDINAFAGSTPDGGISFVCVGEAFVKNLSASELKGILAHEISHVLLKHIARLQQGRVIAKAVRVSSIGVLYATTALSFKQKLLAFFAADFCVSLVRSYDSRRLEKQADLSAVRLTKSKDLANGLEKFERIIAKRRPFSSKVVRFLCKFAPFLLDHPTTAVRKKYIEQASLA